MTLSGSAGTLTFGGNNFGSASYVGVDGGTGTLNVNAGTVFLSNGAALRVGSNGANSTGTVNVGPGATLRIGERFLVGAGGTAGGTSNTGGTNRGTFNMTGGTVSSRVFTAFGRSANAIGVGNQSGGTFTSDTDFTVGTFGTGTYTLSGGTLTVANSSVVGGEGTSSGVGTFTQSGSSVFETGSLAIGNAAGSTGTYNLDGGSLKTNAITVHGTNGSFNWGDGTLTTRQVNAAATGGSDVSSPGYAEVRLGTSITGTGTFTSGTNSALDLNGFYINGGVRFDQLSISGDLALAGGNDSLNMQLNPYLLRPNVGTALDYGSLPLVTAGGELTGTFDNGPTFLQDNIGWSEYTGAFSDAASLPKNTYFLEYNTADDVIFLHYKVEGTVPEPGTMGFLLIGGFFIRTIRKFRENAKITKRHA